MELRSNDFSEIARRNVASRPKEQLIAWISDLLRENAAFEARLGRGARSGTRTAEKIDVLEHRGDLFQERAAHAQARAAQEAGRADRAEKQVEHLQARIREMGLDR